MYTQKTYVTVLAIVSTIISSNVFAHGYIEQPPSRNYFCGAVTKPDQILYGTPQYKECAAVFIMPDGSLNNDGYNYMSILSHTKGAKEVRPLPKNVCGFDSEAFGHGKTLWDEPINWPTSNIKSGSNQFVWNISFGPHFSDTDQFRYWITKPDFKYQVGKPLSWSDFESTPFCEIKWNGQSTSTLQADYAANKFKMLCNVPARQGRHVIYGEWGRTPSTYERFHSCMDVVFSGGESTIVTPVIAKINIEPVTDKITGAGSLILNGSSSQGESLSYSWNISAANTSLYSIQNAKLAKTTLFYANPKERNDLTVSLLVSNKNGNSSTSKVIIHEPAVTSVWRDLGLLTHEAKTLQVGDKVSIRAVLKNGQDTYYPTNGMLINSSLQSANEWTYALANQINALNTDLAIGVDTNGKVTPVKDANSNRIYVKANSNIQNAYLWIVEATPLSNCTIKKQNGANPWWAGFDIATDKPNIDLDFANTGIDLSKVRIDKGAFTVTINGSILRLTNPAWVNATTSGYIGFNADNYPPLAGNSLPQCK